ncbi:hypothetical protein [Blastopirellula retiformator]|uniref:Uncharacterized protein n=1 Tax=Blastopirellula retiformator TaxID=2527970 RepID=A0A5C5V4U9_9BACT|nr:hypothetical protein [Blastopirellula retiformator]TWT32993.1 hypothetical protein Enr8_28090 [Blastopirellula retiformator]
MSSDKAQILERRRVELIHAVSSDASDAALEKRVAALKSAIYGFLKKRYVFLHPFQNEAKAPQQQALKSRWESISTEEVIALVATWPKNPTHKQLQLP